MLLHSFATCLESAGLVFAFLVEAGEESLSEEVTSSSLAIFQPGSFLEVEEEERSYRDDFLLELRLVSLFDLLKIEDGLPFRVGLV